VVLSGAEAAGCKPKSTAAWEVATYDNCVCRFNSVGLAMAGLAGRSFVAGCRG
jgi:hypothetical protein